ncbi:MAG: coproporphyrinogen dehydrogenase HemZ [Tissierellia bacterium]|nr:coproporphyrinogen dehydrogenase HemZ [Tissierellia bacterium]
MLNIETKGFEIVHAQREILRTFLEYKNPEEYEKDATLHLWFENGYAVAEWKDAQVSKIYRQPIQPLDEVKSMKLCIYNLMTMVFDRSLPWGSLTGIRPVAYLEENISRLGAEVAEQYFLKLYGVSEEKYKIAKEILEMQKDILSLRQHSHIIYVHIPFCPSRCKYCSFATMTMDRKGHLMGAYVDTLKREIIEGSHLISNTKPVSIYIGGGTPSTLSPQQVQELIPLLIKAFGHTKEITFEAGRPDTITKELLESLSFCGVDRISVNPQTLKEETLRKIGRGHGVKEVYDAFHLARQYDLDVNMDMILGLAGENSEDVMDTLDQLLKLEPENITVHALAIKNGSEWKQSNIRMARTIEEQASIIYKQLKGKEYFPYYLYRQRRQVGEAENIGYSKRGKENIFNILSMDDKVNVLGFGMGAVSKFVDGNNNIKRVFGYRDLDHYLQGYKKILQDKEDAYTSCELTRV